MTFDEYQKKALKTRLTSGDKFKDLTHWVLGTVGEAGELAEKFKKIIRDKNSRLNKTDQQEFLKEIGDVLWYLAVLSQELGISFNKAAEENIAKLADRQKRRVLRGKGDNR